MPAATEARDPTNPLLPVWQAGVRELWTRDRALRRRAEHDYLQGLHIMSNSNTEKFPTPTPKMFCLHVSRHNTVWTPTLARSIRKAGGDYTDVRGYKDIRYVNIPNTPEGIRIVEKLFEGRTSNRTMVVSMRGLDLPCWMPVQAWMMVFKATSFADAWKKYHDCWQSDRVQGMIRSATERHEEQRVRRAEEKVDRLLRPVKSHAYVDEHGRLVDVVASQAKKLAEEGLQVFELVMVGICEPEECEVQE